MFCFHSAQPSLAEMCHSPHGGQPGDSPDLALTYLGTCGFAHHTMISEAGPKEQDCRGKSPAQVSVDQAFASSPLLQSYEDQELLRLIYYGGIQPEIRKAVWPFLLGHYQFGMTETERKEVGNPDGVFGSKRSQML